MKILLKIIIFFYLLIGYIILAIIGLITWPIRALLKFILVIESSYPKDLWETEFVKHKVKMASYIDLDPMFDLFYKGLNYLKSKTK